MRKRNLISFICVFSMMALFLPTTVFAAVKNPSTVSYSSCLPIVFGGTLIIEALIVILFTDIKEIGRVALAVVLANVASFFAIRLPVGIMRHGLLYIGMLLRGVTPIHWLFVLGCFVVSLGIEILIIWKMLKEYTENVRWVILMVVIANVATLITTTAIDLAMLFS